MKKLKYIFLLIASLGMASCSYLDILPDSLATIEDNAFAMRQEAEKFLLTCYSYRPADGNTQQNPALLGGDEIHVSKDHMAGSNINPPTVARGNQRSNNPYLDYWRGSNGGKNLYRGISDCNIFLANIDRVPDMNNAEKRQWKAEVEFLKAYYHFYLIRMYGPIPIKDNNLPISATPEDVKVYRNTLDECFSYVVNKLDSIYKLEHLPVFIENTTDMGRISQVIVLALKAKVLNTAASPLFNGNTDYAGLKDGRGIEIFNPNKTEEERRKKWAEAAKACEEALALLATLGRDQLYTYENQVGTISDITRNKLTIRSSLTEKWNKEVIWAHSNSWVGNSNNNDYQCQSIPRDLEQAKATTNTQPRNNYAVPMKIAMQFYSKNGVPITEDKDWNYDERFAVKTVGADHLYLLAVGEQTAGLNFDREIRYYASLGFDRGIWYGQQSSPTETGQFVKSRAGDYAANMINSSMNETGIWPKKVIHHAVIVNATSGMAWGQGRYSFPILKLNDLILMYAEALNEAENTDAARTKSIEYVDIIRERAGLKGVVESWSTYSSNATKYATQNGLREIIRQERAIELVFEGQRFWDIRRWKTAMAEAAKPITGWNLPYGTTAEYYSERYLYTQKFTPRNYFWPIHDGEILRNGNTVQNYGW